MKYAIKRHYFNMIEVALALAIIAIGLSSILVLFPVGLNANKSSIANNNLADVAEYMIGYLRAYTIANWNSDGSNKYLEIGDGIYIWTTTNTQSKLSGLKRLFKLYGEDPSDLAFYLRD
ncbi:type IV pilus modification PilV family protein [Victivallis vadensis]|uniref:type IV pilus modification PilV family protein n=1 Tax=Victivallis vadensis TaxID=172901 RepID=UPI0026711A39|nr:hypothetical protein [Victivallis vadensis]